jgi:AraC family transcriptional regulator, transcriptional activator of pobA
LPRTFDQDHHHMTLPTPASQLRLVAVPRLAAGGRWRVEAMRSLSEPCFLWFTKGQGRITISGVTRGYTAHNAIFIPPGVMHGFEAGPQVFGTAVFFGRNSPVALPKVRRCTSASVRFMPSKR